MAHSRISPRCDLTQEIVAKQLRYDADTGVLYRKPIPETNRLDRMRNTRFADKPITYQNSTGHIQLQINGHTYLAHRVIWLLVYGAWPTKDIDHVDGDRINNRLANLREATASQNACNIKVRSDNTSGYRGVYRSSVPGKWCAHIGHELQKIHLGTFNCITAAAIAHDLAAKRLHGDFASLNFET